MGSFSFRLLDRRVMLLLAAAMLIVATVVSTLAMAAQVTERSIELSSSSKDATNVTYGVNFTSVGAAGAFIVDFCEESPILGQACTTPDDFDATAADSTTVGFEDVSALDANTVRVTGTIGAATPISVDLTGIDNPSVAGPVYARIVTYTDATGANAYVSATPGTHIDDGGLAVSITDTVKVTGLVQESMTFCVSAAAITESCGAVTPPVLALGETVGSTKALTPGTISTGNLFTQISTNASQGAVVRLKSNAVGCGGLIRAGAAPGECDILPALAADISEGDSAFGVKTATAASTPTGGVQDTTGTLVPSAGYSNTAYALNYASGDATGVTSTYGDEFLNTADEPANNQNMELVFGATVNNNTPAGKYSADLSLIATGKF